MKNMATMHTTGINRRRINCLILPLSSALCGAIIVFWPNRGKVSGAVVNRRFPRADLAGWDERPCNWGPFSLKIRGLFGRLDSIVWVARAKISRQRGPENLLVHSFVPRLGKVPKSGALWASRAKDIRPGTPMSLTVQAMVA